MRQTKVLLVGLAVGVLAVTAGMAGEAETVESLVKKVDAKLYYPQMQGLRSLQADAQSSLLTSRLEQAPPEARQAKLAFYWAQPYQTRFRVTGVPDAYSGEAREVERNLSMWSERIVPKPLGLALADYTCRLTENESSYVIDARTTAPTAFFWAMKYTIDKKSLLPNRWHISTNEWEADVEIAYEAVPTGQFYAKRLKAQGDGTEVTIEKTHTAVGQFLLVDSLAVTFAGSDGTRQTSTLKLSNFRPNQPIPPDTFPKASR